MCYPPAPPPFSWKSPRACSFGDDGEVIVACELCAREVDCYPVEDVFVAALCVLLLVAFCCCCCCCCASSGARRRLGSLGAAPSDLRVSETELTALNARREPPEAEREPAFSPGSRRAAGAGADAAALTSPKGPG